NLVPAFPQRSPPRLLPAAACGGLRSAPDHRTRRALLHLSYSCAPQIAHTALVTHGPIRTFDLAARASRRRDLATIIFTTCDASANSVATIAKVTLAKLSLGRSSSIDNFCGVKSTRRNRK